MEKKILKGDMMDLFFNFEGRVGRAQYWVSSLLMVVAYIPLILGAVVYIRNMPFDLTSDMPGVFAMLLLALLPVYVLAAVSSCAIAIKRYHDRGKSAWWMFILLIPYIGAVWQTIELGFFKGDDHLNKYGEKF